MESRPHVLMVEDAGPVLGVLRDALGRAGLEVESAQTATEGVELVSTRRYAVIGADCFLPELPPLDWLAALRAPHGAPLIVYSGSGPRLRLLVHDFREVEKGRVVTRQTWAACS